MSNDDDSEYARLCKVQATIGKLVLDGKRSPREVSNALQFIIDRKQEVIHLEVDYGTCTNIDEYPTSLAGRIADGHYGWVAPEVNVEHFPYLVQRYPRSVVGKVTTDVELLNFNCLITTEAVIEECIRRYVRPATIAELLAFGAKFPDEQRQQGEIVALGSYGEIGGMPHVACLGMFVRGRGVAVKHGWRLSRWNRHDRFLVVHNGYESQNSLSKWMPPLDHEKTLKHFFDVASC